MRKQNFILLVSLFLAVFAACEPSSGQKINDNPFEDIDADLKVTMTSNADTLFLSWEPFGTSQFDSYKVQSEALGVDRAFGKSESSCFFTHMPYNEIVKIDILMLDGGKEISKTSLYANIDGIDHTIASKIIPDKGSVTAGDGMYSIALPDGRSIFLMGDSFVCPVVNGSRPATAHMYRNTYIVYDPKTETAKGIYDTNGPNTSAAVPPEYPWENKWYWPLHGFVDGDTLYIFQSLMYMGSEGMWGFAFERVNLLTYSLPDIKLIEDKPINFYSKQEIHYGAAAMNNGDYFYIYAQVDLENGLEPKTAVYCARATKDNIRGNWEYYNGHDWTISSADAAPLEGLSSVPVSSQFNVFKLRDKYVLFTENKKLWVHEIYTFTSDTPYGPWSHKKVIYTVPEFSDANLMCYNAMAHPQFEKDGMILITYDMNTSDGNQQAADVSTYRPRFIWIDIDKILK